MKDNKIKRFLALVLAASMILSDASVAVYAIGEEEQPVYCGLAEHIPEESCCDPEGAVICQLPEHTHIEECYVNSETEEAEATEETETIAEGKGLVTKLKRAMFEYLLEEPLREYNFAVI